MHMCACVHVTYGKGMGVREQLWGSFLAFYSVGQLDRTQIGGLGGKNLYLLSHVTSPITF